MRRGEIIRIGAILCWEILTGKSALGVLTSTSEREMIDLPAPPSYVQATAQHLAVEPNTNVEALKESPFTLHYRPQGFEGNEPLDNQFNIFSYTYTDNASQMQQPLFLESPEQSGIAQVIQQTLPLPYIQQLSPRHFAQPETGNNFLQVAQENLNRVSNVLFETVAQEGFNAGQSKGHKEGYKKGYMKGRLRGYKEGNAQGRKTGQEEGHTQFFNHMLADSSENLTNYVDTLQEKFSQEATRAIALSFYNGLSLENKITFMRDTWVSSLQKAPKAIGELTALLQKEFEQRPQQPTEYSSNPHGHQDIQCILIL